MAAKIYTSVCDLKEFLEKQKKESKWSRLGLPRNAVGFTTGCFDLTHAGHADLLSKAKDHCMVLVVGVTPDKYIPSRKGSDRPYYDQNRRAEIVANLNGVDAVLLPNEEEGTDVCKLWPKIYHELRPNVLLCGPDHSGETYDVPEGTLVLPVTDVTGGKKFQSSTSIAEAVLTSKKRDDRSSGPGGER